tara:strand:+ start:40 stop:1359 length:1320 start_codon:yes stop_codon:yes gene_type:complete
MSLKKFGDQDVFLNTMKAYPRVYFTIYDGDIYYNGIPNQSGTMTMYKTGGVADIRSNLEMGTTASSGFLSLYEYNIDRPDVFTGRTVGAFEVKDRGIIYPFITKDSARSSFRTATGFQATDTTTYQNEFAYADVITGSYPLKASITREYIATPSSSAGTYNSHYMALRNRLNFYEARSSHYAVKSSTWPTSGWNKNLQALNLVSVPSIFYGTKIKPGTVSLKFYYSGSLIGELQDTRQNGELIQMTSGSSAGNPTNGHSGSVAGVVLYDEGFFLLTGSWGLNGESVTFRPGGGANVPRWVDFAAGAQDGANTRTTAATFSSASFDISFKGHTETQVMTMFAHAKRGQVNYSNNPTFLTYGQARVAFSSSAVYEESSDIIIKNTVSSSHVGYNAPFKRQVYISRIGIYDDKKNLIGIATLANPVLKEDDRDYAFKIKLDI